MIIVEAARSGDGTLDSVGIRVGGSFQCPHCHQKFDKEEIMTVHCKFVHWQLIESDRETVQGTIAQADARRSEGFQNSSNTSDVSTLHDHDPTSSRVGGAFIGFTMAAIAPGCEFTANSTAHNSSETNAVIRVIPSLRSDQPGLNEKESYQRQSGREPRQNNSVVDCTREDSRFGASFIGSACEKSTSVNTKSLKVRSSVLDRPCIGSDEESTKTKHLFQRQVLRRNIASLAGPLTLIAPAASALDSTLQHHTNNDDDDEAGEKHAMTPNTFIGAVA